MGKDGSRMVTTSQQKEYKPASNIVDWGPEEDSGKPLGSEGAEPHGVVNIRDGLWSALDS